MSIWCSRNICTKSGFGTTLLFCHIQLELNVFYVLTISNSLRDELANHHFTTHSIILSMGLRIC